MLLAAAAAVVAIDVGHTPDRPGSTSADGVPEYRYNLDMARRIEGWLHRYGLATRRVEPRVGNDLEGRARASAGAALLVSIHHDSSACAISLSRGATDAPSCRTADGRRPTMSDFSGFSVWTSARNAQFARSMECATDVAASLRGGGAHPALFHSWTLPDEGRTLASADGVYRRDGLAVVSIGPAPAILVETAVTANPGEEAWRRRPEVADAIASFIARGISRCLNHSPQF